jgi:hypothetical protein
MCIERVWYSTERPTDVLLALCVRSFRVEGGARFRQRNTKLKGDPRLAQSRMQSRQHESWLWYYPKSNPTTTMKSVIFASIVASALAFAPVQQQQQPATSTRLNEFARGYVGNTGPEPMFIGESGSTNFDPAGFCEVGDTNSKSFVFGAWKI